MKFTKTGRRTGRVLSVVAALALVVVLATVVHSRRRPQTTLPDEKVDSQAGVVGPEDAKVTIVEFSDYQCPFCARTAQAIGNLQEEHPEEIRVIFMDRPLIEKMKDGVSFHPWAMPAHEASAEAAAQGDFKKMHVWIFTNQKKIFALPRPKSDQQLEAGLKKIREKLVEGAKEIGLDHEKMRKALKDHRHKEEIMKRVKAAQSLGINGTPTIYVNNKYAGSNFKQIKSMANQAMAKEEKSDKQNKENKKDDNKKKPEGEEK
ncbi:MAG: thioredoxin domain-containing protein [bacterium]